MKYLMSVIAAAMLFTACNSANEEKAADQAAVPAAEAVTEPAPVAAAGPMDPVCNMEKDATWTEYSVNGADTTWFCSATCKEAFDKNPAKYTTPKS